jgi:RecA-family ATPase
MLDLRTLQRALGGQISGGRLLCPGPGHSAADRSLSIKLNNEAPDGFLVYSFSGDDPIVCKDYVREKLGLPAFKPNGNDRHRASDEAIERALAAAVQSRNNDKPKGRLIATYDYTEADGTLLYQVLRYEPKDFRQRRPDGNGGFIWSLGDVRHVPYRLPELSKYPDATIFVCEGEKDADRVAALGHCATTVAAGKWTEDCVKALAGHDCLILQDKDAKRGGEPGRTKALAAARTLHGAAKSIRIVLLPELNSDINDVSDWLDTDPRRAEKLTDVCFDVPLWSQDEKPGTEKTKDDAKKTNTDNSDSGNTPLPFINMQNWDNEEPPLREWAVPDRIPLRQVTLFSGEGAAGKSTVQLHLSAAHPLARDWLGTMPTPGPAIFVDAEDDIDEIHRRLAAITRHYEVTFSDLINGGLHLISLAGDDAVLATATKSGKVQPTPRYQQLLEAAGDIKPKMIGIASSANVFAGEENSRPQVQQFIGLLTKIAIVANGAVQLISHPSLTGINSDTGLSGTTQWHNAVRARSYMKSTKPEAGEQPDHDLRELVIKKNNYGPISESIVLRYQNGLFLPVPGMSTLNRAAKEAVAEDVFLTLLRRFTTTNRMVFDKAGRGYAPAMFAREDEATKVGITGKNLEVAMRSLFKSGKIWNEPYGKPSRPSYRIAFKS